MAVYVKKQISPSESFKYVQEWKKLNPGFDRRDLTEFVGFDERLNEISHMKSLVLIDCRNGKYYRYEETYFNEKGDLVHGISSKDRELARIQIPKGSVVDELAINFCEKSAY